MADTKLVVVGEAPGGDLDLVDREWMSMTGGSAKNLCRIAGWDWETFLRDTLRMNLFYHPVKKWDSHAAARNAMVLSPKLNGQKVILLGSRVATAFELEGKPHYEWFWAYDAVMARIPHPSGLNRMWNKEAERDRAREFLGGLL